MKFIDEARRQIRSHASTREEHSWYRCMLEAQVFEIDNITHLLPEWGHAKNNSLPVRPPYDNTWVEFKYSMESGGYDCYLQVGALFQSMDNGEIQFEPGSQMPESDKTLPVYGCLTFFKVLRMSDGKKKITSNITTVLDRSLFMVMKPDGSIGSVAHSKPQRPYFGLPLFPLSELHSAVEYFEAIWPALMAFSMLHCKNITTVITQPPPKLQKATIKRGHLPLVSYRTLDLIVDDEVRKEYTRDIAEDERSRKQMRFHLVRGHFKHLQHDRFRNPGLYWWPQHWRGDPEAGVSLKDYNLNTRKSPK